MSNGNFKCVQIKMKHLLYGCASLRQDNPRALAEMLIAQACICTLCFARYLTLNIGISMKGALIRIIMFLSNYGVNNISNCLCYQYDDNGIFAYFVICDRKTHTHTQPFRIDIVALYLLNCNGLTLCFLLYFPIQINSERMGVSIIYFKGSQVENCQKLCTSATEYCIYLSNQCRA